MWRLLFWAFPHHGRSWLFFILLFGFTFYLISIGCLLRVRWLLWVLAFSLPLPWIAAESGWIVAEVGPPAMGG